jgi:hypothetical protein
MIIIIDPLFGGDWKRENINEVMSEEDDDAVTYVQPEAKHSPSMFE